MLQLLQINAPYPFESSNDGATANFLTKPASILRIVIPGLTTHELWSLKKGNIKAGFLYEKGEILWLFQFFGKDKKPVFTLDAPFDARLIPRDLLDLHDINHANDRLSIEIHAIDSSVLKALRIVTLSPKLTLNFLSSVQEQLSLLPNPKIQQHWQQQALDSLAKQCKLEKIGV